MQWTHDDELITKQLCPLECASNNTKPEFNYVLMQNIFASYTTVNIVLFFKHIKE